MSLDTVDDARRVARLSRAEYDVLLHYLEALPPEGWTASSACSDWQVYQVVSHIGSQPRIHRGVLEAGLRGAPPMTDAQRKEIWAYFDRLKPNEVLPPFRQNNDDFFKLTDSLTDDELAQTIPWLRGESPVATVLAGRLNEQVLHAWDIKWARDKDATLSPAAVPILWELNLTPDRIGGLAKTDRAQELVGKTAVFLLTEPEGAAALHLDPDGVQVTQDQASAPDLTVELPTETFIRLLWGRSALDGRDSARVKLSQPELAGPLQALFPGR